MRGRPFFREMSGSRNREKNYGGVAGGWFPGTIVDGWRDREEIIAGGNRDSGFRTSSGASYIREFRQFLQGFASFIGSGGRPKLAEKVVTPYGNSPYTGGCSFNSYRK